MPLIHHTRKGTGKPPIVFVHGFGCARSDWDSQVAAFDQKHETIAVDLGGHGTTPGLLAHTQIETHGEDVAHLMRSMKLAPSVVVGHSMGCRVAMEAALRAPEHTCAVILVDGSRMGYPGSASHIERAKGLQELGYETFIRAAFEQMFAPGFDKARARAIVQRALDRDPAVCGPLFVDIGRYDAANMDRVMGSLKVPLLAIQTTWTSPDGRRVSMTAGQSSPYLDLIRQKVPGAMIEVIPDTGHFPQLERVAGTNASMARFLDGLAR